MYKDTDGKYKLSPRETRELVKGINLPDLFLIVVRLWNIGIKVDKLAFIEEVVPRIINYNVWKMGRIPDTNEVRLPTNALLLPSYYHKPLVAELRHRIRKIRGGEI